MTKVILLTLIAGASALLIGCGGKTAEKETPKVQPTSVASNSDMSNSTPTATRNDGDADDVKTANSAVSNSSNANRATKPLDRDDSKSANRSTASNGPNNRGDADDRGRNDSDGDSDDR